MNEEPPGEKPRWSFTWLIRIQRTGRSQQLPPAGMTRGDLRWIAVSRVFPWVALVLLLAEIALLAWLGIVPR